MLHASWFIDMEIILQMVQIDEKKGQGRQALLSVNYVVMSVATVQYYGSQEVPVVRFDLMARMAWVIVRGEFCVEIIQELLYVLRLPLVFPLIFVNRILAVRQ